MTKSEQINELAAALSKAQGEIENATKDVKNTFFNSKYADLAAVLSEIRPVFSKYGLSLIQTPSSDEKGYLLTTILLHSSGQFISSQMALELTKQDMQGLGSALTYARRYMAAAFAGIHQEDDDGNAAAGEMPKNVIEKKPNAAGPASGADLKRMFGVIDNAGIPLNEFQTILSDLYSVKSSKELKTFQVDEVCATLRKGDSGDLFRLAKERKSSRPIAGEKVQ